MKKVLIVTSIFPPEIGGPASYVPEVIRRLGNEFEFSVVTFTQNPDAGIAERVISVSQNGGTLRRQWRLFQTVLSEGSKSDVIFCQDPLVVGLAGVFAGRLLGKKVVIKYVGDPAWEFAFGSGLTKKFLDDFLLSPDAGWKVNLDIFLTRMAFSMADKVIVPSKYLASVVRKNYGQGTEKLQAIHNAFEARKYARRIYGLKRTYTAITPMGRLVKWKRVDEVIMAIAQINKSRKLTVKLQIVGDGPERTNLEILALQQAKKFHLHSFVDFLGQKSREEGITLLAKADLFILNSIYEGLPHTALEAFAVGTPVLTTDIPGTNEIAINGSTALTVKPGQYKALTTTIISLLGQPDLRKMLAQNGSRLLEEEFNWNKNLQKLRCDLTN